MIRTIQLMLRYLVEAVMQQYQWIIYLSVQQNETHVTKPRCHNVSYDEAFRFMKFILNCSQPFHMYEAQNRTFYVKHNDRYKLHTINISIVVHTLLKKNPR